MGREILEILAYLPFNSLLMVVFFVGILLNCENTYCLKVLLAVNLLYLDS